MGCQGLNLTRLCARQSPSPLSSFSSFLARGFILGTAVLRFSWEAWKSSIGLHRWEVTSGSDPHWTPDGRVLLEVKIYSLTNLTVSSFTVSSLSPLYSPATIPCSFSPASGTSAGQSDVSQQLTVLERGICPHVACGLAALLAPLGYGAAEGEERCRNSAHRLPPTWVHGSCHSCAVWVA